ncbi:hypothetical protein D3C72_1969820 [compost metagenome]
MNRKQIHIIASVCVHIQPVCQCNGGGRRQRRIIGMQHHLQASILMLQPQAFHPAPGNILPSGLESQILLKQRQQLITHFGKFFGTQAAVFIGISTGQFHNGELVQRIGHFRSRLSQIKRCIAGAVGMRLHRIAGR